MFCPRLKKQISIWKKDPVTLLRSLEIAILRADEGWAKQFFGYIVKLNYIRELRYQMPRLIARVAYYKFYKLLHTLHNSSTNLEIWGIIKELIYAYKARDAFALCIITTKPLFSNVLYLPEVNNFRKHLYGDDYNTKGTGPVDLLPETRELLPSEVLYYGDFKLFKAVEFLLHTRREPNFIELTIPVNSDVKKLPYYYCLHKTKFGIFMENPSPDIIELPINDIDMLFDSFDGRCLTYFIHEYTAYSIISIEPEEGDDITYTNNYLWFWCLDSFLLNGMPTNYIDRISELCDTYISCILTGEKDA